MLNAKCVVSSTVLGKDMGQPETVDEYAVEYCIAVEGECNCEDSAGESEDGEVVESCETGDEKCDNEPIEVKVGEGLSEGDREIVQEMLAMADGIPDEGHGFYDNWMPESNAKHRLTRPK